MRTVNEGFGAIKEVTLLRAQEFFIERFARQSRAISRAGTSTLVILQSPKYVLECLTVICLVGVALYLRNNAPAQGPWMAQLSFVAFAAYRLLPTLQQSFAAVVKLRNDRAAFAGIETELQCARSTRERRADVAPDREWHGRPLREIRLCNVSFRYAPDRSA